MNGIYLRFVNKHLYSWLILGLQLFTKRQDFRHDQMSAFADDRINVAQMMISAFDRVENKVKRRKRWLPACSSFPTIFSMGFFLGVIKTRACVKS